MKNKRKKRRTVWLVVIILFALFCYSRFSLASSEYELEYSNLPQGFDGYRIVQISDLHMREFGDDNSRLLKAVKKQEPDIIVLTGDLINRKDASSGSGQAEKLRPFLEALVQIAPCWFVSGNHEWASGELPQLSDILDEVGITYLHNDYVQLESGGDTIILAGVEDPNGPADMTTPQELVNTLRADYPNSFVILLGHRNYWIENYPELDVDLIFCGHAHGGIWRLPIIGGLIDTDHTLFPEYTEGVYNEGGFDLVVSRGLGDSISIPRLFNRPELVTAVLKNNRK